MMLLVFIMFNGNATGQGSAYELMVNTLIDFNIDTIRSGELYRITNVENDLVILDAREPSEYNVSHISSAINVGYYEFDVSALKAIDRSSKLIVYCSVGYRSEKVAEKLKLAGFSNIFNLYGGIFEWVNEGYPTVNSRNIKTKQIHGYSPEWGLWIKKGEVVYDE